MVVGVAVCVGVLVDVLVGVLVGGTGVFVGVLLGVNVAVFEGVNVAVLDAVFVGVFVGVGVGVLVGVAIAGGRTGTAPSAHDFAEPSVQVIVTDAAPAFVLERPITSLGVAPVAKPQSWVWPAPGVAEVASPRAPSVSKTTSPTALVATTVGLIVLLPALTKVPKGVA